MTHPFINILPDELKSFFFDFDWDPEKVWKLEIDPVVVFREELDWHLEHPFWSSKSGMALFDIVPSKVLLDPLQYSEHYERVKSADLTYPIDMMWTVDRYLILDGMHRLAKLNLNNIRETKVRIIPRDLIELIKR